MARQEPVFAAGSRSHELRRARPKQRGNWGMRLLLFIVLAILVVVGGGLGYGYYDLHSAPSSSTATVAFPVRVGDTDTSIANRLQRMGLINNALLFRIDARLRGLAGKLHPGTYTLRRNMSIDQIVGALAVFIPPREIRVTIPEGWRAEQIAQRLQYLGFNGAAFLKAVYHPHVNIGFATGRPRGASLNGFLFPDTYEIPEHASGAQIVQEMVHQFALSFTPAMRRQAHRRGFSVYQIVTMASIVEREARVSSERPTIASVYFNRLNIHMLLQADPTVQYALDNQYVSSRHFNLTRVHHWWPLLTSTAQYSSVRSPYNTYLHPGLPPGPICNPGLASIKAALKPQHTQYYFFVAKGNGHHVFARTYAEQQANIAKYG